jgi:hypothetical protein
MFDEATESFKRLDITSEEAQILAPNTHLFVEGQDLSLFESEEKKELAKSCKLHAITPKDLVVKNSWWLIPGKEFYTNSTKTDDDGNPTTMKLKVRKRSGGKTYLRPVVDNTRTIRRKHEHHSDSAGKAGT